MTSTSTSTPPGRIFDHVGIVVPTLERGQEHLSALFGITQWTAPFTDPVIRVHVQFGRDPSGMVYETVAPLDAESPISLALRKGDRILNHVAYLVGDLEAEAAALQGAGCLPAGPANPAVAYGGAKVQFFVSPLRFIVELIEAYHHIHDYAVT